MKDFTQGLELCGPPLWLILHNTVPVPSPVRKCFFPLALDVMSDDPQIMRIQPPLRPSSAVKLHSDSPPATSCLTFWDAFRAIEQCWGRDTLGRRVEERWQRWWNECSVLLCSSWEKKKNKSNTSAWSIPSSVGFGIRNDAAVVSTVDTHNKPMYQSPVMTLSFLENGW